MLSPLTDYGQDKLGILRIWEGGLTFYGGLLFESASGCSTCGAGVCRCWGSATGSSPDRAGMPSRGSGAS